ncbi:MAG: AAC(3) family N-acetyltransferase [Deltaproteobacteria bacterium]|nr:AAC(3) family N-acetyltransferase [Deltaproteobacteria bacterium]
MTQQTAEQLIADLRALGLDQCKPAPLIVHSGFRSLGPVAGGPATAVNALLSAVGDEATILMPGFTTQLTDPYVWPVPPSPATRAHMLNEIPAFDPVTSPPHKMGAIVSSFWRRDDVVRSAHPVTSWLALGPRARELTDDHDLGDPEGIHGPVGRVFESDGWVLLLGVDHDANTTIHLAESLLDMPHLRILPDRYPVVDDRGKRVWRTITKTTKCSDGFVKLSPVLEAAGLGRRGLVGQATAQLFRSRDIVRIASDLLGRDPAGLLCDDPECVHCPSSRASLRDWKPLKSLAM